MPANHPAPSSPFSSAEPLLGQKAGEVLARLREIKPRIHVLTNPVAQVISANALLALGAQPSMTADAVETPAFLARSPAALVNLGMMTADRRGVLNACLPSLPRWVLDPVKVELSPERLAFARMLLAKKPNIIKLNRDEADGLLEKNDITFFAKSMSSVVAMTGAEDIVTDGTRICRIMNGSSIMTFTTALGCTAGAIMAACLAVEEDAYIAAIAALFITNIAGEQAGRDARGPGSFVPAFIDALYHLTPAYLNDQARYR